MKPARGRALLALLCLFVWGMAPARSKEPEPILAPFGMSWGLAPDDIEEILRETKIPVSAREQEGSNLSIEVTGLRQKNLLRAIFHFEDVVFCELEIQLGRAEWTTADYSRYFLETKKVLDVRYGRGFPLVIEKSKEGNLDTFFVGYYWSQFGGNIRLFLFQASSPAGEISLLSQHYRAF